MTNEYQFKPLGYPFRARLDDPPPYAKGLVGYLLRCKVLGWQCGTARVTVADDGEVMVSAHAGPFMDGTPPRLVLTEYAVVELVYESSGATIEWGDEAPKPDGGFASGGILDIDSFRKRSAR